jgi:hypothetical protein
VMMIAVIPAERTESRDSVLRSFSTIGCGVLDPRLSGDDRKC